VITRIVIMNFQEENVGAFLELFSTVENTIRSLPGCEMMELKQNIGKPSELVTISKWVSEEHLNAYRNSEFFKDTWSKTKALFSDKAQALSLVDEMKY